jgi:hypothetical protein
MSMPVSSPPKTVGVYAIRAIMNTMEKRTESMRTRVTCAKWLVAAIPGLGDVGRVPRWWWEKEAWLRTVAVGVLVACPDLGAFMYYLDGVEVMRQYALMGGTDQAIIHQLRLIVNACCPCVHHDTHVSSRCGMATIAAWRTHTQMPHACLCEIK